MIHFTEPRIVQAYLGQRLDRTLHNAETEALLRRARVYRPSRSSPHRRLMCRVGQGLISLGKRLEQYGPPPSLSLEEQIGGSQGACF